MTYSPFTTVNIKVVGRTCRDNLQSDSYLPGGKPSCTTTTTAGFERWTEAAVVEICSHVGEHDESGDGDEEGDYYSDEESDEDDSNEDEVED
jgi:hypothetical protein